MASLVNSAPSTVTLMSRGGVRAAVENAAARLRRMEKAEEDPAESAPICVDLLERAWASARPTFDSKSLVLDDLATPDIPVVLAPFYLARAAQRVRVAGGPGARAKLVQRAEKSTREFLELAVRLVPLEEDDDDRIEWEEALNEDDEDEEEVQSYKNAERRRERALSRHARRSEAKTALEVAQRDQTRPDAAADDEEAAREVGLCILKVAVGEALDDLRSLKMELDMLKRFLGRSPENEEEAPIFQIPAPPRDEKDATWLGGGGAGGGGGGIRVLRVTQEEGQAPVYARDEVKARVFQPTIAGPTQTLEEFADLEIAEAQDRARRDKEGPTEETRRREELERDSDDGDDALYDGDARDRSENWAVWKESHPTGYGNKGDHIY